MSGGTDIVAVDLDEAAKCAALLAEVEPTPVSGAILIDEDTFVRVVAFIDEVLS